MGFFEAIILDFLKICFKFLYLLTSVVRYTNQVFKSRFFVRMKKFCYVIEPNINPESVYRKFTGQFSLLPFLLRYYSLTGADSWFRDTESFLYPESVS